MAAAGSTSILAAWRVPARRPGSGVLLQPRHRLRAKLLPPVEPARPVGEALPGAQPGPFVEPTPHERHDVVGPAEVEVGGEGGIVQAWVAPQAVVARVERGDAPLGPRQRIVDPTRLHQCLGDVRVVERVGQVLCRQRDLAVDVAGLTGQLLAHPLQVERPRRLPPVRARFGHLRRALLGQTAQLGEPAWARSSSRTAGPGLFPDPKRFAEHYAKPIERSGDTEALARLRRRIKPLVLPRTKELVAADLPAKQAQVLDIELSPRHRKLYDTRLHRERQKVLGLLDDLDRNRITILRSLTLLRQLSLHPALVDDTAAAAKVPCAKLHILVEHLREVVDGGHRALVFSQFTRFLSLVCDRLDADGVEYCYLDGSTTRRDEVVRRFKEGTAPAFLISLEAGGVGLNLTEADNCFLLDPWWNPATEAQAVDRIHRIGQTRNVMVYRLIAAGTIEEKVMALNARKAELFAGVMDEGGIFDGRLDADDIRALLA